MSEISEVTGGNPMKGRSECRERTDLGEYVENKMVVG